MRLSEDGSELLIYNLKPVTHPQYTNEVDRGEVLKMRSEKLGERNAGLDGEQHLPTEVSEDGQHLSFNRVASAASCKIADIKSFIFGGFASRFWMMRKHVNSLPRALLKHLPFYSWDCITLELGYRDINLVVRNEQHMATLVRFLSYRLRTIDGQRDSAVSLIKLLEKQTLMQQSQRE